MRGQAALGSTTIRDTLFEAQPDAFVAAPNRLEADRDAAHRTPDTSYGDLAPAEAARTLLSWSSAKTTLATDRLIVSGVLAGVFIAFGAAFFIAVIADTQLTYGPVRMLGGVAFSMGLLFVCMTGAELSTGNCMMAAAWASRRVSRGDLTRVLALSYAANAAGALLLAVLMMRTGLFDGAQGRALIAVAETKMQLGFEAAFFRGILCNALVCIAVWLIVSARTIPSKLLGSGFPIAAFIATGFEHSIANLYLLPSGLLAGASGSVRLMLANIAAVTLGNLVGGVLVGMALWFVHLRNRPAEPAHAANRATLRGG